VADPISRDVVLGCTDMGHSDLRQIHDKGHLGPIANFFKGPKRCDLAPAGFGTEGEQPTLPHQLDPAARIAHDPNGIAAPTIATLSTSGCAYPHLISPTLRDFVIPAIRTEPPLYFPPS